MFIRDVYWFLTLVFKLYSTSLVLVQIEAFQIVFDFIKPKNRRFSSLKFMIQMTICRFCFIEVFGKINTQASIDYDIDDTP